MRRTAVQHQGRCRGSGRLKPVDIYYHTYSASKPAALNALHKVFAWTERQALHPVFASEYITKVHDFHTLAIGRDDDGWRIRGNGDLRTLRLPDDWRPRLDGADGVAGFHKDGSGNYLHLTGATARFALSGEAAGTPTAPYLLDANARIVSWESAAGHLRFALKGHQALDFRLANVAGCQTLIDGKPAVVARKESLDGTPVSRFKLNHAAAQIEIACAGR